jgi:hypothetical protein
VSTVDFQFVLTLTWARRCAPLPTLRTCSPANAPNKLPNRRADRLRRILLNKVDAWNRDFALVRPSPAEVAHRPDDLGAGIGIDEKLRQIACGEPVATSGYRLGYCVKM